MAINESYLETLTVAHNMFKHIFNGLETRFAKEMAIVREQYHSEPVQFTDEPCIVHWHDGIQMIRDAGFDVGDGMQDLTGAQELALGAAVKEKYGTDFFMLDQYPASIRPFYTMPMEDRRFSNSYDMFIRGQEICSGAQRCHDPALLREVIRSKGLGEALEEGGEKLRGLRLECANSVSTRPRSHNRCHLNSNSSLRSSHKTQADSMITSRPSRTA